jgi:hypothetical protein
MVNDDVELCRRGAEMDFGDDFADTILVLT